MRQETWSTRKKRGTKSETSLTRVTKSYLLALGDYPDKLYRNKRGLIICTPRGEDSDGCFSICLQQPSNEIAKARPPAALPRGNCYPKPLMLVFPSVSCFCLAEHGGMNQQESFITPIYLIEEPIYLLVYREIRTWYDAAVDEGPEKVRNCRLKRAHRNQKPPFRKEVHTQNKALSLYTKWTLHHAGPSLVLLRRRLRYKQRSTAATNSSCITNTAAAAVMGQSGITKN